MSNCSSDLSILPDMPKIKLSDYVVKYLEALNVKHVFMLPGGGAMHLNDSLGKSKKLKYVCCLHEQACAIAAEAYSRVTEKIGLCMITTGPGGTNALTGVAGAFLESIPVLIVSGQVKTADMINGQGIRQQGMQELDMVSIAKPITKYAKLVLKPQRIKYYLDKAVYLATHGRPGPVWLDIPLDIQATLIDINSLKEFEAKPEKSKSIKNEVLKVIDLLNSAERPILLAGHGIRLSGGIEIFKKLYKILQIPILTTWNGIDLIEENNKLYFGRPGGIGHRYANFIQQNSDFFMSIGARLNLLQTGYNFDSFARAAVKIQVDIDEKELCKTNVRPNLAICADAKLFMQELIEQSKKIKNKSRIEWFNYCRNVKNKYPLADNRKWKNLINPYNLIESLSQEMKDGDIYVSGSSGACIDISMQAFKVKKGQRVFSTHGLAAMGYGLPSAIGAALASGKKVVSVIGDGGFQMNIQELETIRRLNLPIKIFVLCNSGYGAIRNTQTNLFKGNLVACTPKSGLTMPNISAIAKAYKLSEAEIKNDSQIEKIVLQVLRSDKPVICTVQTPIDFFAMPKQISYKRSDGQMESLPLEYMNPPLPEDEFKQNMLVPLYELK